MENILNGLQRFHDHVRGNYEFLFRSVATRQQPEALLITCSDSRIVPDLLCQSGPGDLFICRNAGNIVPPYDDRGGGVAATVEYAVDALGTRHIIVCGHSNCGAMNAVLHPERLRDAPTITRWLSHAERARRIAADRRDFTGEEDRLRCLTEENVLAQLDNLATHPAVAASLARGQLELYGWYFDIPSATVWCYDRDLGAFAPFSGDMPLATPRSARLRARRAETAA